MLFRAIGFSCPPLICRAKMRYNENAGMRNRMIGREGGVSETKQKQLNYTIACIHDFARKKRISQQEAYLYLRKYKGLLFLSDCYEIEHTLSMEDALDDMENVCKRNGGRLS